MRKSRIAAVGAVASLALLAGIGIAAAQTPMQAQNRVIEVPPGAMIVVIPGAGMLPTVAHWAPPAADAPEMASPFPALPDPQAMFLQVDQMMRDMQRVFASPAWMQPDQLVQAALRQGAGSAGLVVETTVSDGHGVCTRREVWTDGAAAAPKVDVSAIGNACGATGQSPALPVTSPARQAGPRLWQADYRTPVETPTHRG